MPFREAGGSIYCGSMPLIRQFVEDFLIHIWNEASLKIPVLNVQDDEIKLRKFLLFLNIPTTSKKTLLSIKNLY